MPTARTGHGWSGPGWDVNQYRFNGNALFDDYDFGSDCALHNESLSDSAVFAKGVSLFRSVINYAHERHVKIGLGIDIDLIPASYNMSADDPKVIQARIAQLSHDYPDLDYLFLYISENIVNQPTKLSEWKRIFMAMYKEIKQHMPTTRIVAAGWGLAGDIADSMPADVVIAPISSDSDAFEDGSKYGNREYDNIPVTPALCFCPGVHRSAHHGCPHRQDVVGKKRILRQQPQHMKNYRILYWVFTVLFAGFMAFSGIGGVKPSEDAIKFMHDGMGYPIHFIQFISAAKIVGAIALLIPIPKWLKEWAYAGMFFDLLGAFWALSYTAGSIAGGAFIFLPLIVGGLSYYFWKKLQA